MKFESAHRRASSGPNQISIEPSLFVATLLKPLVDGISCGVSGIVPSVML